MFYLLQSMKLFCPKISEHKNMSGFYFGWHHSIAKRGEKMVTLD